MPTTGHWQVKMVVPEELLGDRSSSNANAAVPCATVDPGRERRISGKESTTQSRHQCKKRRSKAIGFPVTADDLHAAAGSDHLATGISAQARQRCLATPAPCQFAFGQMGGCSIGGMTLDAARLVVNAQV